MKYYYIDLNENIHKLEEKDLEKRSYYNLLMFSGSYSYIDKDVVIESPFYIEDYSSYLEKIKNNN